MMWLLLAFLSAALLGFYDAFKKESLRDNAVLPVLFLNTLFSSLIFLPFILISAWSDSLDGTIFHVPAAGWEVHKYVLLKSVIVLSSWTFGYFGMKHLPLTIVGPINATRPVMVLVGALLVFGERLNLYQWAGVLMAVISFFMLSRSGKKEGIDFKHNRYIFYVVLAAVTGAISGLYDKYLMAPVSEGGLGLDRMVVQSWYNIYQLFMMGAVIALLWLPKRKTTTPFHWDWCIILISIFLSAAGASASPLIARILGDGAFWKAVLLSEITGSLPAAAAASGHLGAAELIEAVNIGAFGTLVQLPAVAAFRIVGKNGRKEFALLYTISSAILLIVFITMHIAASCRLAQSPVFTIISY